MSAPDPKEPVFSPDFAARVLGAADAIATRRRSRRRIAAAGIGAACAAIGVVSWAGLFRAPGGRAAPRPTELAAASESATNQSDDAALAYLFPDATPVADFASQYADANDDTGAELDVLPDDDGS